ncbi:expressed unknown protein [Seminavis robusta]|uniref:Uncharacterized protein n=1 Tax=Seminavis robusta TaxID=568900 RepID=A0A9N8DPB9_9STRA|nr:expressed unknown protein [Seminavis robusta]|eukprot:Sro261_g101850.1 n/a (426) ;mRNA; f:68276-69553
MTSTAMQATRIGARALVQRSMVSPSLGLLSSTRALAPQKFLPRHFTSGTGNGMFSSKTNFALGMAGGLMLAGLHSATGSADDFYEYRFKTNKSPDDLASFYGGEELMELFCIFPFVGQIMMRNGEFDDVGNFYTTGVPGTMKVSMVFSDEVNEETGETEWFNKRERFRNTLWGYSCWDMVSNFGFRTLEDGQIECYHYGEYFHGNLPVVSQVMKLVFQVHARWVAWSTEHHINRYAFTADTDEEEEMEEESRKNMPLFLLKNYAWSDLMAMIFGVKDEDAEQKKSPSFLVRRPSMDDEKLPIQSKEVKIQISQDIAADRASARQLLARSSTQSPDDVKVVLARSYTIRNIESNTQGNAYGYATEAARVRHMSRRDSYRPMKVDKQPTMSTTVNKPVEDKQPAKSTTVKKPVEEGGLKREPSSVGA